MNAKTEKIEAIDQVAIIGMGLIGSSIARAAREALPGVRLSGYDEDPEVRARARALNLVDEVYETAGHSVAAADLVILCVPVGAMAKAAEAIADRLPPMPSSAMSARRRPWSRRA